MSFETRNEKWTGDCGSLSRQIADIVDVWDIAVSRGHGHYHWGQEDGACRKLGSSSDRSMWGSPTKTAAEVALDRGRRLALLKYREGYREVVNGRMLEEAEPPSTSRTCCRTCAFAVPENSLSVKLDGLPRTGKPITSARPMD